MADHQESEISETMMDASPVVILDLLSELVNRFRISDRVITYCNKAWADQYGVDRDQAVGRCLDDFLSVDELDGMHSQLDLLGPARPVIVDQQPRSVPGTPERWVEWVDRYVVTGNGPEVLSVGRDVTDRRLAELRLQDSEARFRSLADHATDIVWRLRLEPSVQLEYVSPSAEHVLGYPASFFLEDFSRFLDVADEETRDHLVELLSERRIRRRFDLRLRHADGSIVVGETTTTIDHDHVQGVIRDVTELRRLQEQLSAHAMLDPLTGIANRRRFDQLLQSELERTADTGNLGVAYVDLDGLKRINDVFGHAVGDAVLCEAAGRLCRAAGGAAETVSRLGGDEFAIIFEPDVRDPADLVERIDALMTAPIVVSDSLTLHCSASVGIADTRSVGRSADVLVTAADQAMFTVKRRRTDEQRDSTALDRRGPS